MTSSGQKIIIGVVVVALLGLFVIGGLVGAAVYGWKAAQKAGDEAATVQNIKTIAAVEIQYYKSHNQTFGTFDQLIREQMLTSKFSGSPATADGYLFTLKVTARTSSHPASYTVNADPQNINTGTNHFYIDSNSSNIHGNPNQPASANDPPL